MAAKPWIVVPLVLTVDAKEYPIQPLDYRLGLSLKAVAEGDSKEITDDSTDEDMFKLVMGEAWQQMLDDGCPFAAMFRAGMASVQYQIALLNGIDSEAAAGIGERVWESGIDPEMLAAMVSAANPSKDSKPSTPTGSARKTPSRASTKTTTSRRATPRTASKKTPVKASPGRPSRGSGR
jgi:hypothetical protein